jgi:hypothetical protein
MTTGTDASVTPDSHAGPVLSVDTHHLIEIKEDEGLRDA